MSSELLIWESTVRSSKHSEQISLKFYIKTPLNIRMNLVGKQEEGPKKECISSQALSGLAHMY